MTCRHIKKISFRKNSTSKNLIAAFASTKMNPDLIRAGNRKVGNKILLPALLSQLLHHNFLIAANVITLALPYILKLVVCGK